MKQPNLADQDKQDLAHVIGLTPQGVPLQLDLSDERQYRFLMRQVNGSGVTKERYPRLFADLDICKTERQAREAGAARSEFLAQATGMTDVNLVSGFGSDNNGKAASQGFSSIVGGTIVTQLYMQIFDIATGNLLASNLQAPVYGKGQYQAIQAVGQPVTQSMRMVYTYSYTTNEGPQHGMVHYATEERPAADPQITEPTQKANHAANPYIVIGLSRGLQSQNDVDYWFNQQDWNNPNVTVPFVGHVSFNSNIVTPLDPATNFQAVMYVVKPASGGGQQIILPAGQKLIDFMTVGPATQLNFNMPSGPNRGDGGTPATFGSAPWSSDTVIYFHFQAAVKTATSGTDFVFANVVSRDQADTDPVDGTLYIKPLQFVWHCLTKGTQIRMADGTSCAIENITGGERVTVDASGNTLTVVATIAQNKDGHVLCVSTKDGGQVNLTKEHPLVGPNGVVQAEDLKPGDEVYTENGVSPVTSITRKKFSGGIFNVSLGVEEERNKITENGTTLIAGGILVGDMQIYHTHQEKLRSDPDYILKNLPEAYHTDFRSSLEDAAR